MSRIEILNADITRMDTDAIVIAANSSLLWGGGVCGAIFSAAGGSRLQEACARIGHCPTGSAVITPGFDLKAKYIIHAVGPVWNGDEEATGRLLTGCYRTSLELAEKNGCASIAFPLISSGIYGVPKSIAWKYALKACHEYEGSIRAVFCVLNEGMRQQGLKILEEVTR